MCKSDSATMIYLLVSNAVATVSKGAHTKSRGISIQLSHMQIYKATI